MTDILEEALELAHRTRNDFGYGSEDYWGQGFDGCILATAVIELSEKLKICEDALNKIINLNCRDKKTCSCCEARELSHHVLARIRTKQDE